MHSPPLHLPTQPVPLQPAESHSQPLVWLQLNQPALQLVQTFCQHHLLESLPQTF